MKDIFAKREEQKQVTHTTVVLTCAECGHEEHTSPLGYGGESMLYHYVREHVPRKTIAGPVEGRRGNVEVGMALGLTGVEGGLVLYYCKNEAVLDALARIASGRAHVVWSKPGWYIDVMSMARDHDGERVQDHAFLPADAWTKRTEAAVAELLGRVREVRAATKDAP